MLEGHCECRKVSFKVNGEINQLSHCHCSQCRRLHGAAYGSYARVMKSEFQYLTGSNEVKYDNYQTVKTDILLINAGIRFNLFKTYGHSSPSDNNSALYYFFYYRAAYCNNS